MANILIFGGTTEGRELFENLISTNKNTYLCVATDFGKEIVNSENKDNIFSKRLNEKEIEELIKRLKINITIDATHPFAVKVTENIKKATQELDLKYLRVKREIDSFSGNIFESIDEAVNFLKEKDGNILVTTGSNEISKFTKLENYKDRVFARVLSVKASIEKCLNLGIDGKNLICMQGKFTENMNIELIRLVNAKYLVTKNSGKVGGFEEKISACEKTGVVPIVIMPKHEEGKSVEEVLKSIKTM